MNFGLLGYGFMGGAHLAAMAKIEGVTVTTVSTRTRPSADAPVKGNLDLASGPLPDSVQWTPEWRQVLADPSIDAVDICLPTNLHHEVMLAAFAAGKHVFCEKPMALTSEECEQLVQAAAKSGKGFMVGQVLRFMFPYRYALQFVERVGRSNIRSARLQRSTGYPGWGGWLGKEECSGGAILDLLSHDLDQALLLFGQPVAVSGVSFGEVDTLQATLRHADGLKVRVEGGWVAPETAFSSSFEIGTAAETLSYAEGKLTLRKDDTDEAIEIPADDDGYYGELAYFVDCVRTGAAPRLCPPIASAQAVEISNVLKRSRAQNGKEILWQA